MSQYPLNPIQQAFTLSNEVLPLSVVCVLHLSHIPDKTSLQPALVRLQQRHSLLRARIVKTEGAYAFRPLDPPALIIPQLIARQSSSHWREIAEQALNTRFETDRPLMKCWLLADEAKAEAELIVNFHHALIDGHSARLLLHEILSLWGGTELAEPAAAGQVHQFPPAYRGSSLAGKLLRLAGRQIKEEFRYRQTGLKSPVPQASHNRVLTLRLSTSLSRQISLRIGRRGLSLNSILSAAIAQATQKYQHPQSGKSLARIISFADLRSQMLPPVAAEELGCYVSMLRLCVPYDPGQNVWELARALRKAIFQASRRGELFLMSWLSRYLIRMTLGLKKMRLGLSALSYIGKLDLQTRYGELQLQDVNAFITNNQYGPEFSAFGKILFGRIGLDFTYLPAEISEETARKIVKEVQEILENIADLPNLK